MQHFAFAYDDVFAVDQELERALQDVSHLLAFMLVHRHERAAFQVDLGHHLALTGDDLSRDHLGNFVERDFIPSV